MARAGLLGRSDFEALLEGLVDLARDLERANDNFYDWEQRDIDEYLIKIFD